jgi:hypothetical protein
MDAVFISSKTQLARMFTGNSPAKTLRYKDCILFLCICCGIDPDAKFETEYTITSVTTKQTLDSTVEFVAPDTYRVLPAGGLRPDLKPSREELYLWPLKIFQTQYHLPKDSPEMIQSISSFRFKLAMRDRRCVVTGKSNSGLHGAHIIPYEWIYHRNERLPTKIQSTLFRLDGTIDNIQNGMLLKRSLHKSFQMQQWSVVPDGDDWRIVAMTDFNDQDFQFVGKKLKLPDSGVRVDGVDYKEAFVHPEFFAFHLKAAIYRHMRGSPDLDMIESEIYGNDCAAKVLKNRETFRDYIESQSL